MDGLAKLNPTRDRKTIGSIDLATLNPQALADSALLALTDWVEIIESLRERPRTSPVEIVVKPRGPHRSPQPLRSVVRANNSAKVRELPHGGWVFADTWGILGSIDAGRRNYSV
ncbi:hypothetical protein MPC4_310003 [Methylocella tundrae]|uniref:Uncharacterized protein n=1 Tax=Methylocella tundrae TaxID=227605 RepID=A0A8B6M8K7_METTU|nr:hypothetical protein MPC1_330008 [Methylocella tundrae]VTZ51128.1 hypothetical protein MPC4_310003 [Methylocella tundrae]